MAGFKTIKSYIKNHNDGDNVLFIANNIIIPTDIAATANAIGRAPKRVVLEAIIPSKGS